MKASFSCENGIVVLNVKVEDENDNKAAVQVAIDNPNDLTRQLEEAIEEASEDSEDEEEEE